MDKREKNKIIIKRMVLPALIWAVIFMPYHLLNFPGRDNIFIGSGELLSVYVLIFGFIKGDLLKRTTPQYIIRWFVVIIFILQYIMAGAILALVYL